MAVLAVFISIPAVAAAPTAGSTTSDFDYPELLVTPRSSERVASEAAKEASSRWASQIPIQVSALSTLVAGIAQLASPDPGKDVDGTSGIPGVVVGGTWIVTSLALEAMYQPYASSQQELGAMPAKTSREQLVRERYAEESIKSAARLGTQLRWLSFLTNLGANGYMIYKSNVNTVQFVLDAVGAGFSFAPLVFTHHWNHVANEQESYKKRIYAPIASAAVLPEPGTGNLAPGAFVTMRF